VRWSVPDVARSAAISSVPGLTITGPSHQSSLSACLLNYFSDAAPHIGCRVIRKSFSSAFYVSSR
jgi:hypothetical protein